MTFYLFQFHPKLRHHLGLDRSASISLESKLVISAASSEIGDTSSFESWDRGLGWVIEYVYNGSCGQ